MILRLLFSIWPPYFGAGIRIKRISKDFREVDVEMKLRFWNKNYVGTHFGGSLYAMVDPFYMLMIMNNLGREYIVWDKAASIKFVKPGKSTVHAHFRLTENQIHELKEKLQNQEKIEPVYTIDVVDDAGTVIAHVEKTIYIRKKKP